MVFTRESVCLIIVLIILMGMLGESVASVHKVGGSAGWTILGKVDYNKWTSSDTFTAGDSLLFVYNSQFHNVKQVSRRDFLSCNATSAMATYTSGSDMVALTKPGHFYFLCGFPGHCQAVQKLHVLVGAVIDSPSLSPASTPVPSPSTGSSPSPARASEDSAQNGAFSSSVSTALSSAMSGVVVFLVALV
ncbi:PREDICTED: mavicyanin-like [Camelina sativa]|uniref:Mavicyanin-like n=1 Tax=Camelina sativa TaxID=90675 RepID=A0ABM0WBZ0_CAMSA|nr:PREDICTED: mavicyanin-like [Camelina sativa]